MTIAVLDAAAVHRADHGGKVLLGQVLQVLADCGPGPCAPAGTAGCRREEPPSTWGPSTTDQFTGMRSRSSSSPWRLKRWLSASTVGGASVPPVRSREFQCG